VTSTVVPFKLLTMKRTIAPSSRMAVRTAAKVCDSVEAESPTASTTL